MDLAVIISYMYMWKLLQMAKENGRETIINSHLQMSLTVQQPFSVVRLQGLQYACMHNLCRLTRQPSPPFLLCPKEASICHSHHSTEQLQHFRYFLYLFSYIIVLYIQIYIYIYHTLYIIILYISCLNGSYTIF